MSRKKTPPTETVTYEITPELHQRATEFLVDILLKTADDIGSFGARQRDRRSDRGFRGHTSAEIVTELAAQMAVRLARYIHDGELLVRPANPKP